MGLDFALSVLILVVGIRGWLKGFLVQAIRLAGLVTAVYVAEPVRDEVKPYVVDYLPSIRPDLVDRIFWWTAAVSCYFVIVGVASLGIALSRRHTFGLDDPRRGDQMAGFALGAAKGLILAAFLVAGIEKYGQAQLEKIRWAGEQARNSYAWEWNEKYHPAVRIWGSAPVREFVNHIHRMGLTNPSNGPSEGAKPVQTASRTPSLALPALPPGRASGVAGQPRLNDPQRDPSAPFLPGIDTSGLNPDLAGVVESILKDLPEFERHRPE
jgi:uncharacterized membrane protein required for colicin V production